MSVTLFKQSDSRWNTTLLGNNTEQPWNLGRYGCLVSSEAMLVATVTGDASWTPLRMNEFLKANGGFDGGLLRWPVISKVFPFIEDHGKHSGPNLLAEVGEWVKDGPNYAVLEIDGGVHFVLLYQVGTIADPADGKSKRWANYHYTSARFYRFVGGKGGGQAAPAPAPNGEPAMTDDQEQDAYLTVLGRPRERAYSGRTGYEFINGAKGELAQQRKANADLILLLQGKVEEATTRASNFEVQLNNLINDARSADKVPGMAVPPIMPTPAIPTYTSAPTKAMDAITATERLHSGAAQTYGLWKMFMAWFKKLVLK